MDSVEVTGLNVKLAQNALRDPVFKSATDIHGRAIESAIYRMHNSEIARCYLRLVAAQSGDHRP